MFQLVPHGPAMARAEHVPAYLLLDGAAVTGALPLDVPLSSFLEVGWNMFRLVPHGTSVARAEHAPGLLLLEGPAVAGSLPLDVPLFPLPKGRMEHVLTCSNSHRNGTCSSLCHSHRE